MRREAVVNRSFPVYPVLARLACSRPDHYLEGVIVWFAVALWVEIVAWSLALMRASGGHHAHVPGSGQQDPRPEVARPRPYNLARRRWVLVIQGMLLATVVGAAALVSTSDEWQPWPLAGLLVVLVVGGVFIVLEAKRFRIGGSSLGLVLVMAVLGPAPAVALGLAAAAIDAARHRPRGS